VVLPVGLRLAPELLLGLVGMTQLVRQFDACELQIIMQVVVVKVRGVESPGIGVTTLGVVACAKAGPDAAVIATMTVRMIPTALITAATDLRIVETPSSFLRQSRQ
jgi:hypothetical protein